MKNESPKVDFKIGLDLRFLDINDDYSVFIATLLQELIRIDKINKYKLYLSPKLKIKFHSSIEVKYIGYEPGSLKEQVLFLNILNKDKNNLVIFFNEKKPLLYKGEYILFIKDLKELHYKSENSKVKDFFNNMFFDNSLKNATRVVCFENQTKHELNEKLNIQDEIISIINPFFQKKEINDLTLINSVKVKYSINGEFFVYSGGSGNNKNLSKLISAFEKINKKGIDISLIILNQEVTEDIEFRNQVIAADIVDKVLFIGDTNLDEKKSFYDDAIGTIFPSLYESFPFSLTESINYNSPILASSIKQIKEIMGNEISYFSPVSTIDMVEAIEIFISNGRQNTNYENLFKKYNPENSAKNLLTLIEKI